MSLVTIGLDFGTSSIKCIARPSGERPRALASPSGAFRWRSMLGRVREGDEGGRLLLFEECDEEQWRFSAHLEANLKLALLSPPTSPPAEALSSRWQCEHYALPTLLLGAALHHALRTTRTLWPGHAIHVFCGAPVSPTHPPEQTRNFERALYAAHLLADRWGDAVPRNAAAATRDAERAWSDAASLPSLEARTTFVVPEAFAACEGVVSAGGGARLPIGRLCIVDMGGGTTDIAWVTTSGADSYHPLRIESIDVAGDRLDAELAKEASRRSRRHVTRHEIWQARSRWRTGSQRLAGDGWSFEWEQLSSILGDTLDELASAFKRGLQKIDVGAMRAPETKFIFVGGATHWEPLAELFLEAVGGLHKRTETISVSRYGLSESTGEAPMAVALGLSNGHNTLDLERWAIVLAESSEQTQPDEPRRIRECPCKGNIPNCPGCGGSGWRDSEAGRERFEITIDPFADDPRAVRCPYCMGPPQRFPRDQIFAHINATHSVQPPLPPVRVAVTPLPLVLRIDEVRRAHASGDRRKLTPAEGLLASDLWWMQCACLSPAPTQGELARAFLRLSVGWCQHSAWFHLPRAVAFGILGDAQDVAGELRAAEAAGFQNCHDLRQRLDTDSPTRFAEAWECAVQ